MSILHYLLLVVLVGLLVWAIRVWTPLEDRYKNLASIAGIVFLLLVLLYAMGLLPVGDAAIPRVR